MKYYKIIVNNEFIGAISSLNFFVVVADKLIASNDAEGQFIEHAGKLYRDYWMQPVPDDRRSFTNALITEISKEDYFAYVQANRKHEPIEIEEKPIITEEIISEPEPTEPDLMLEYIRTAKLNEVSATCREVIEQGFNLEIQGETKHFSLTTQDQLNLMDLSILAQQLDSIPYHADGEEVKYYTAEEINSIVKAATMYKIYHTTYHNALKAYINSLNTIEEISKISYGTTIPEEYKTDIFKTFE